MDPDHLGSRRPGLAIDVAGALRVTPRGRPIAGRGVGGEAGLPSKSAGSTASFQVRFTQVMLVLLALLVFLVPRTSIADRPSLNTPVYLLDNPSPCVFFGAPSSTTDS